MDRKYNVIADEKTVLLAENIAANFDENTLIESSNKGTYKRALKDLDGISDIFASCENDMIKITLSDVTVTLSADIKSSRCSCSSKVICRHIISAAIAVSQFKGNTDQTKTDEISKTAKSDNETKKSEKEIDFTYLEDVKSTAVNILKKGIMNCTANDCELFVRLSLRGGSAYRNISNLCRSFSEQINLMNTKNADFSQIRSTEQICRLYNIADAIIKKQNSELLKNTIYENSGKGYFICLGIYPRRSESGYAGITAIFLEKELNDFFTYNITLPDFYKSTENAGNLQQLEKLAAKHIHWQNDTAVIQLSGKNFTLMNYKSDERRRISSSKQTSCLIGTELDKSMLSDKLYQLPENEEYDYFFPKNTEQFFLIKNPVFTGVEFNSIFQRLDYKLSGDNTEEIQCNLLFNEINSKIIRFIENNHNTPFENCDLLVRIFSGKYYPVSIVGNKIINICF